MKTFNRAVDMTMPVGSSIKPIAVYAPAIELGASPASIVMNMPLPISGWRGSNGQDSWPRNYGGSSYAGPETLRKALVNSHNTAAAQALMTLVGVDNSVAFLHAMGIDDAHIDATPFGLSLGSSGITPMQMAVAFGVLANGGVYQQPISVLGISDSTGKVIWDGHQQQERHRVFSESTAYMVVDMLKQAVSSGTGTNAKIKGQTVAGKTGTNSDQKGVFFAGMTGYYSSALWVGHDNYKALSSKSTGSRSAAPLWQSYMSKIHQGLSNRDILEGSASDYGLVKVTTCAVSGQLATDACRSDAMGYGVVTDYWKAGTEPTVSCQMHTTQTICSVSGLLASPYCPDTVTRGVLTIPSGHPLASFIGTDVTKNVADMVLSDDNFATIVTAVEEGRRIYDNIRKAIQFLLASNMSEVLGVFFATLLGFTLLNPVHLLFINLITDCFPALALGLEKGEPDTMTRPPRDSKDGIFAGGLGFDILYQGVLITIITMTSYIIGHCMEVGYFEMPKGVSDDGMTMAFLTMSMCEIFHSFNMRSQRKSVFSLPSHNKVLWGAMVGSLALTTLVLEVPVIANAFGFTPVSWTEYGVALALAFLVLPVVELVKLIQRRAARRAK